MAKLKELRKSADFLSKTLGLNEDIFEALLDLLEKGKIPKPQKVFKDATPRLSGTKKYPFFVIDLGQRKYFFIQKIFSFDDLEEKAKKAKDELTKFQEKLKKKKSISSSDKEEEQELQLLADFYSELADYSKKKIKGTATGTVKLVKDGVDKKGRVVYTMGIRVNDLEVGGKVTKTNLVELVNNELGYELLTRKKEIVTVQLGKEEQASSEDNQLAKVAYQIETEVENIVANLSKHYPTTGKPSLTPLATLIKTSQAFWSQVGTVDSEGKKALVRIAYSAYADLEMEMYKYWGKSTGLDDAYLNFIEEDLVKKAFIGVFNGQENKDHNYYGTGRRLYALAKEYEVYQEIQEISTDIQEVADKYSGDSDVEVSMAGLGTMVDDAKTLLKGGHKLKVLITKHYKNTDLCDDLFEALADWELARTTLMEELSESFKLYYNIFNSLLTRSKSADEIEKESVELLKNMATIEKLLPKFAEMDAFRQKVKKLDKKNRLSKDLNMMKKAEKALLAFVDEMVDRTKVWFNKYLTVLVENDKLLIASNKKLEEEQKNFRKEFDKIRKKKEASSAVDWDTFWSTNEEEKALFQNLLKPLDTIVGDNQQKRKDLDEAFTITYKEFAKVSELV